MNQKIKEIFEITDDSLQDLLLYYLFLIGAVESADRQKILNSLPPKKFPHTHAWDRNYIPDQSLQAMDSAFLIYHTRTCLISQVSIFESGIADLIDLLNSIGKSGLPEVDTSYYRLLVWTSQILIKPHYPDPSMQGRTIDDLLDVDNARRLRNLYVHNGGLYDSSYIQKPLALNNRHPKLHPDFQKYQSNIGSKIPVLLNPDDFLNFSKSHIELLHILHYEIQYSYFGVTQGYNYAQQQKPINWLSFVLGR